MLKLREYRQEPSRLPDLLIWAGLLAPGVVLNKNGSLQASFRFRGPDLESATASELIAVSARLNNVLKRLRSGWAVFIEAQRRPALSYQAGIWPDMVSALIDEERRAKFAEGEQFESEYYLTLVYQTATMTTSMAYQMLYEHLPEGESVNYRETIRFFQEQCGRFEDLLTDIFPMIARLDDSETLTYLHSTVSTKRHPLSVPSIPMYLDVLVSDQDLKAGVRPMLGANYLRTLSIKMFPNETFPGILEALNELGMSYRYVVRYLALDREEAVREIRNMSGAGWPNAKVY